MSITKVCIRCGEEKPRSEFYPCNNTLDRRTEKCKDCYKEEKEAKLAATAKNIKINKEYKTPRFITGIPATWAANKKVTCTHPTSKCWLSYQKALCCLDCLGFDICTSEYKCKNHPSKCTY